MNALSVPGASGWFQMLVNVSVQAALLTALVWAILKVIGRWIPPNWRALLWFVVIARVLVPIAPPSPFSLRNLFVKESQVAAREIVRQPLAAQQPAFDMDSFSPPESIAGPAPASAAEFATRALNWVQIVSAIWVIAAGLSILLLFVRSVMIHYRVIRYGSRPTPFILGLISDCRSQLRLRYPVRATVSDRIAAPALTGLIPARLIIPTMFGEARFNVRQLRQILLTNWHTCNKGIFSCIGWR